MKKSLRAIVVLSGGQDSATCLALAVRKYGADAVGAITFAYGQRHAVETKYARRLARHFGIAAHKVVRFDFYKDITTNALLDPKMVIRESPDSTLTQAPPNTVVEGRNAFFLLAAAVWAKAQGATILYTGVSQTDYSGYPDCRAAFVRAQEKAIRLALDYPIRIETPFMKLTKAQEWALAARLGIFELIRDETVTCYNGIPGKGCGKCPACRLRNNGLAKFLRNAREGKRSPGRWSKA